MTNRPIIRAAIVFGLLALATPSQSQETTATGLPRLQSLYVEMRDGVKIAIDVWLPGEIDEGDKVPALIRATRYWRAENPTEPGLENENNFQEASLVNGQGYALVFVDARGTGASFGSRAYEMTEDEWKDYGEIVDWIVAQPWSNGRVGAYGVSYDGNTAEMLAINGHPAVRAVAPQFNDFNWVNYLIMPGGVTLNFFLAEWGQGVAMLDANDVCGLMGLEGDACAELKAAHIGVKPVDADTDYSLLKAAVQDHANNMKVYEALDGWAYHDDPLGPEGIRDAVTRTTPFGYLNEIERSNTAMYVPVGWLDAATVNGALSRYKTLDNVQQVVIGPWSHGGGHHTDPFLPENTETAPPRNEQRLELLRFMDNYLKTGATAESASQIRYYTMNAGRWNTTHDWPLSGFEPTSFYFGPDGALTREAPAAEEQADTYPVDFTATTGQQNRWRTNAGGGDVVYADRREADDKLLTYTSAPLSQDMEITGHPLLTLHLASTRDDGALFAYLEAVAPDGHVTYITEGQLRMTCRAVAEDEAPRALFGPYRTYARADAVAVVPGEIAEYTFDLWATSVLIRQGHRIRIAIAGADADNFARYPAEGDATWTIHRSAAYPSQIVLPMKSAGGLHP